MGMYYIRLDSGKVLDWACLMSEFKPKLKHRNGKNNNTIPLSSPSSPKLSHVSVNLFDEIVGKITEILAVHSALLFNNNSNIKTRNPEKNQNALAAETGLTT